MNSLNEKILTASTVNKTPVERMPKINGKKMTTVNCKKNDKTISKKND